ncbi:MAG: aminotransferase class I/II-fold pyridoxal phosphate-dependent enzyme [Opitutales bacterium]|jgi:aminotransferase|nr:aminotransferase class I/II-fold pyridoxal phosphate-dependent enzyme [Opitutales bacterium]MDP4643784.1 aminotransferase class I/II-fold pyridoxal phosphate-dependent enzyme [Opitutales bacterium]MDP4694335.1 aminotransferase class I/II-fold pyridoxal phosphate-dependent enzyme [Opitutales bacterium]MDP4777186.1 aminotransferase class I/II-fold pyridoxal phosphate-dependent enzyme [Opitutales bacterium]MDP4884744.1 aminotransferase class I/II-fold pyridoxal phosphate-dependent enzyme [Opitu
MSVTSQRFVADHVLGLPRSGIRDFFAIVAAMPQAISLGIGEPDFVTPWHIREAAIFALEKGKTSYTDNLGLIRLRREISTYVENHFDVSYHPEKEILVAVGVSEALDIALRAVLNPGDKVLYHEPCYVSYSPSIILTHAKPIKVATSAEDQFAIDPDRVAAAWEPGCKVLILNFPTNPTGGVTERAKLEKIAKFAVEKDLLVISDEIYSELTFEGEHTSIASLPGMKDRTIFLHGFSKAFAMTGFRIGYACGPQPLIDAMMKIHQYSMLCAPILSQEAALEALKNGAPAVAKMKEAYHNRRDLIVRRFNEMGLDCHLPKGSFYAFPSIKSSGMSSIDFCKGLLEDQEVAIVPGTAFGESGAGFARASFSTSYDRILEATNRIERYVEKLSKKA